MYCMFCHINLVFCNSRTKESKWIISYYQKQIFEKNVDANHVFAQKKFEHEMNTPMKVVLKIWLTKKSLNVLSLEKLEFLVQNVFSQKDVVSLK
jgi:hypothetical protein